jgi:uncharacterized protein YijF (DUF1287 family)
MEYQLALNGTLLIYPFLLSKIKTTYSRYNYVLVLKGFKKYFHLVFFIGLLFAVISATAQDAFFNSLSDAAIELTKQKVTYNPEYFKLNYPNGDIPADKGVCTDVIIRAYRKLGVDLQKEVHEDMKRNFNAYPKKWGMRTTDTNIDHRRVPNLMTFFKRQKASMPISENAYDYKPGDVVTWDILGGAVHIGIVINKKSADNRRYLIVHNIGYGQEISDCLFMNKITGHYRYKKTK